MILYTLMLLTLIIPLTGLAIDLTIMYIVQAKLWEAIDGAALEAGHLMGTTTESLTAQAALAQQICATNFPTRYWNAYGLNCVATPTLPAAPDYMYKVDITARVNVPLWFMKVFQSSDAVVSASAQSSRRQARVVLVLDRSGSMSGSPFTSLKSAATAFVTKFNGGYDQMGLVVFGTSGVVVYPILNAGPYNFATNIRPTTNTDPNGGPNTQFKAVNGNNAAGTSCCDMIYAINKLGSAGATNMSEGLSLAYLELQKGHNASMSANGYDVMRSVIVLFTDGVPNMFAAYLNSPDAKGLAMTHVVSYPVSGVMSPGSDLLLPPKAPFASSSPVPVATVGKSSCYYNPLNTALTAATIGLKANQMLGVMGAGAAPGTFNSNLAGLIQMASYDVKSPYTGGSGSSAWALQHGATDEAYQTALSNVSVTDCLSVGQIASSSNSLSYAYTHYQDLAKLPPWDFYGNNLTALGNGYTYSTATSFPTGTSYTGTAYKSGGDDTALGKQLNIAAWNAVDNAANRIRSDIGTASTNVNPTIYTIGYSGTGGTDDMLLARVANDPNQSTYGSGSSFNQTQAAGQYFPVSDSNAITDAFNKIGSILLNLSR